MYICCVCICNNHIYTRRDGFINGLDEWLVGWLVGCSVVSVVWLWSLLVHHHHHSFIYFHHRKNIMDDDLILFLLLLLLIQKWWKIYRKFYYYYYYLVFCLLYIIQMCQCMCNQLSMMMMITHDFTIIDDRFFLLLFVWAMRMNN